MAKKKRSRKVSRRRSVGAIAKRGALMDALTIIAGATLGGVVKKFVPGTDTVKNGAVVAAGFFLPKLMKGSTGANLGAGMVAYGGVSLVKGLVDPSGKFIGAMDDQLSIPVTVGQSDDNLSVIAGDNSVIAGDSLSVMAGYGEDY